MRIARSANPGQDAVSVLGSVHAEKLRYWKLSGFEGGMTRGYSTVTAITMVAGIAAWFLLLGSFAVSSPHSERVEGFAFALMAFKLFGVAVLLTWDLSGAGKSRWSIDRAMIASLVVGAAGFLFLVLGTFFTDPQVQRRLGMITLTLWGIALASWAVTVALGIGFRGYRYLQKFRRPR